jgi:tetratricopeptide (TPR) repeat protein
VALVWLVADAAEARPRLRAPTAVLALATIASSASLAYVNVQYWRNNLTLFTHGVEVSPRSSLMHSGLASAYINLGQLPAAEKELRLALHLDFDELRDWKRLAGVLLLEDRVPESIDIYLKIVEQEPGVAENHLMLALALEKAGRIPEARAAAERAAAINPQNPDPVAALKRLRN